MDLFFPSLRGRPGATRIALVVELEVPRQDPWAWARVVVSIPGRTGTVSRLFPFKNGVCDIATGEALHSELLKWLLESIEVNGGVRMASPF